MMALPETDISTAWYASTGRARWGMGGDAMVESASELARVSHHVSNGVAWWHTKPRATACIRMSAL